MPSKFSVGFSDSRWYQISVNEIENQTFFIQWHPSYQVIDYSLHHFSGASEEDYG